MSTIIGLVSTFRLPLQYKLGPITPRNFYDYMTYGYQVNTGTEESKNQAAFVTQVLDIYENSYDFDK